MNTAGWHDCPGSRHNFIDMRLVHLVRIIIPGALLATACTEPPPPSLSFREREVVDSLFKRQVDTLHPVFDSLCKARMDSLVQHFVDSIMTERTSEIEEYLERIKGEKSSNDKDGTPQ